MLISLSSFSAQAKLMQADYLNSGDQLAVYDSATNLTWLDLSLTINLSYNQAATSFAGYRLATKTEVETLFGSLFGTLTYDSRGISNNTENVGVPQFQTLFGLTEQVDFYDFSYGFYQDETNTLRMAGVLLNKRDGVERVYGTEFSAPYNSSYDQARRYYGSYLVKQSAVMDVAVKVNEPHTSLLFLMTGFLLVLTRIK